MKLFLSLILACLSFGCTNSNIRPISNTDGGNAATPQSVIAHTTENQPPKNNANKSKPPGGEAIDTKELDAAVAKAEKQAGDKGALAKAYFDRGVALTEAKQYAAALGDYRRAVKANPSDAASQQWIDTITNIFRAMGRPVPAEGAEPAPLPFTATQK
jgi:tetratricopeptide (TPR) repeat protein